MEDTMSPDVQFSPLALKGFTGGWSCAEHRLETEQTDIKRN